MTTNIVKKVSLSYADCERIERAASEGKLRVQHTITEVRRGEIYIADLGNGMGSEQQGVRPVLIIQNDIGNHFSKTVIVIPITSATKKELPTHLSLARGNGGLAKDSTLVVEQMRTIDKTRLYNCIGKLSDDIMSLVNEKIMLQVGIM